MTATQVLNGKLQFVDQNGVPLVGGKVYYYIPNTSTLKNTWQDADQEILNTNPVELDSLGSAIVFGVGQYRQLVTDVDDNVIWDQLTNSVTPSLYFDVKAYGAVGDGIVDDTEAIETAIADMTANGGGTLFFPQTPNTYLISSRLSLSNMSLRIMGEGIGNSVIKIDEEEGIFNITQNSDHYFTTIQDISLRTTQQNIGTAVTVDYSSALTAADPFDRFCIDNVEIRGATGPNVAGFRYGLSLIDVTNPRINGLTFTGYQSANTVAGNTNAVSAIKMSGADTPQKIFISQSKVFYCTNAVDISGTVNGVYIDQCSFANVDVGVSWQEDSGTNPLLFVNNCQINCFSYGVAADHVTQPIITNCLIHKNAIADIDTVGIFLENSTEGIVAGNTFVNLRGTGVFNPIVLGTGVAKTQVKNNILDTFTNGIWFQTGSAQNFAKGNTYFGTFTEPFIDDGTQNAYGIRGALVYLTSNESTPNNSDYTIVWDTTDYDTDGFLVTDDRFVIPAGRGIKRVRLTGSARWASNPTGTRTVVINKNGTGSYPGRAGQAFIPSDSDLALSCSTAIINVSDGDEFTLVVNQDSGGSLNVLGSGRTCFSIEVIE